MTLRAAVQEAERKVTVQNTASCSEGWQRLWSLLEVMKGEKVLGLLTDPGAGVTGRHQCGTATKRQKKHCKI